MHLTISLQKYHSEDADDSNNNGRSRERKRHLLRDESNKAQHSPEPGSWGNEKSPFQGSRLMSMCFNVFRGDYGLRQKLCIDGEPSIQTNFSSINPIMSTFPSAKACE